MNHILSIIIIGIFLFSPSISLAEMDSLRSLQAKEIISEGTYNMGDGETPSVAESRALLQAKRIALEQAGTYVESYTKVKNLQLTEDEIKVLSSGLMEVEILDKKRTIVGDGFHFWVKIKAIVNLDKTEEMAKRVKEKSVVEDYKKIQEAYDKSQKDIEELKKQLAQAKGEKEKKQVEAKITKVGKLYQAVEWYEKGNRHILNGEYDEAIKAYSNSLSSEHKIFEAYANRGNAYAMKGQYDEAIEDYSKALDMHITKFMSEDQYNKTQEQYNKSNVSDIPPPPSYHELTLQDANIYSNRGIAYAKKMQFQKALDDLNKSITINPSDEMVYNTLGKIYVEIKQYDKAIEEYSKAIKLKPEEFALYINRGTSYNDNGQYDLAIEDYKMAIELKPELSEQDFIYVLLGMSYIGNGNYDRAIQSLNKAIVLNSNSSAAYYQRGIVYAHKGNKLKDILTAKELISYLEKSLEDWNTACELGEKRACENLRRLRRESERP